MERWYYCPGSRRVKAHRCTLVERFQMWRRARQRRRELVWF